MPETLALIALLASIGCAFVLLDIQIQKSSNRTAIEGIHTSKDRLSDLVVFSPFVALFYTEGFWNHLLWTFPPILAVTATQWACHRKGWLGSPPELVPLAAGSYLLATAAYFLFFHEGLLEGSPTTPEEVRAKGQSTWATYWPYAGYFICFLLSTAPKKPGSIVLSLLFLIPAATILPFFTGHYFWFMLLGALFVLLAIRRGIKKAEAGSAGALSVIGGYFYAITAFGSLLVYAVLY